MTDPRALIGAIVSGLVFLILLDVFFLGWFLVDEPILRMISEATGSVLPLLIGEKPANWRREDV